MPQVNPPEEIGQISFETPSHAHWFTSNKFDIPCEKVEVKRTQEFGYVLKVYSNAMTVPGVLRVNLNNPSSVYRAETYSGKLSIPWDKVFNTPFFGKTSCEFVASNWKGPLVSKFYANYWDPFLVYAVLSDKGPREERRANISINLKHMKLYVETLLDDCIKRNYSSIGITQDFSEDYKTFVGKEFSMSWFSDRGF